ncbi:Cilia- and flagella-associated protein 69 [Acipenser ruthenus]|uniref:Nibrin n=1 Tax=Acipenser ruthenus TaxID=7906 RepID=A0A444TZR3_ACIRT|nr:Cilia- and flagella-associated protein 69 [Acipenser ruthenus]
MWKLIPLAADGGEPYYLTVGVEYVVGRKNCAILLESDQSISRVHAHLSVNTPAVVQSQASTTPTLTLKDTSKYGTFVNEERLQNDTQRLLQPGDRVTFGVFHSKFRVEYESLIVCSSCLDGQGKITLNQSVKQLGGCVVNSWTQDSTHLVMPSVKVTIKTICALICCRPIVKPEYFTELLKAVQLRQRSPKTDGNFNVNGFRILATVCRLMTTFFTISMATARTRIHRVHVSQRLCICFHKAAVHLMSLIVVCHRVDLSIADKVRILEALREPGAKQVRHKRLSSAVVLGGGEAKLLDEGILNTSLLESAGNCVIDVGMANSQMLVSTSLKKWIGSVTQIVQRKGLRLISEAEIGLAVIYMSTDTYCNPLSQTDTERSKTTIPGATLSQSMAVDETVMPAAMLNITAYAPDTEPSQQYTRMETSGVRQVNETPEKDLRGRGQSRLKETSTGTCTVAETAATLFTTDCGSSTVDEREKTIPSTKLGNKNKPSASNTAVTSGNKKSSSQQQSNSLANFFQPLSKKREREENEMVDLCQAKQARTEENQKKVPACPASQKSQTRPMTEKRQSQIQFPMETSLTKSITVAEHSGMVSTRMTELTRGSGDSSPRAAPKKRKDLDELFAETVAGIEDLEDIMSQPMEQGQEEPQSVSKKKRIESAAEAVQVKQEDVTGSVRETADQTQQKEFEAKEKIPSSLKKESHPSGLMLKSDDKDDIPRNLILTEFKSLVVSVPARPTARLPFLKERSSEETTFVQIVTESISQMGFLMRVPSNQVRIQICDSIISFYKPKISKQHVEGFLPTNPSYKVQMAEQSGLAETLVLSLALLENQFEVKLRVLQALQMLSGSSVKSHNPLVRSLKLSFKNEDFEMKKLLFNLLVVMSKDLSAIQLFTEGKVLLSLFHYVKPNDKPGPRDWSAAQYEELQLHALATLATVAPLLIDDYMTCQGNTRLLLLLEWCVSQDAFFGQGNSFHGTGGRGNKKSQMRYCLRLLRSVVSLSDETVNHDLCDQGALDQLLGILKKTVGDSQEEDTISLEIKTDILLIASTLCENDLHRKKPLLCSYQEEEKVVSLPANSASAAVMDVSENMRAKIFSVFCKLGFEDLAGLTTEDYVTLAIISRYLDFKLGEVWNEISRELEEEGLRPVTPDVEALESIAKAAEDVGRKVATLQADMLENQQQQDLQDEKRIYTEIQMNHQQYELTNKSWDAYVARTSNYEILKDAKSLQMKAIESSKPKMRQQDAVFHPIQDTGLHTNFCGRLVTVDSTPAQLTGGPLANTDLALEQVSIRGGALQKTKAAKEMEQYQMGSISVK